MYPFHALFVLCATAQADTAVVPVPGVEVTGTRVRERILRAPAAITVVDRSAFGDSRTLSLSEALGRVPGLFVQSRSGAQDVRVTIRGYGARGNGERSNVGNMRGIRVMTDGVDVTEPDGRTSLDLVDLGAADQIEVTRSNASAHYGNATGGLVHIRTNLDFDDPWIEAASRAGSFGFHREGARAGFGIGRTSGVVSLTNSTLEGWRDHSSFWSTVLQVRARAPLDDRSRLGVLIDGVSDLRRFPGALTQAELDADPQAADSTFEARDERRRNRVGRVALDFARTEGGQDINVTAYVEPKVLQRSERGKFRDFNRYHVGGSATWQERGRLAPNVTGRVGAGIDEGYQDGSILFYNLNPDGSRGTDLTDNKREAANRAGGFVEGEATWNERWALRLTARFDAQNYIAENRMNPALNATTDFTRWTPKGSLSWMLERSTIYFALGGGIEAPAFNEVDPPFPLDTLTSLNPFLEPMRSTTWELGAKGTLGPPGGSGTLRYDVALYWIDVHNDLVPFDGGIYFLNAGQSRRQGAEMGLGWQPTSALLVEGTLTLSRNRYIEYQNQLGNFEDHDVAGLPGIQGGGRVRYEWPGLGLSAEVSAQGAGAYFADDANTARVGPYTIFNGTLGWTRELGASSLRVFVTGANLADRSYVASVFINGVNGRFYEPGMPRNVSAGLTLRWQ